MKIICMAGAARSGKDTVASFIKNGTPRCKTFAFATALKESAGKAFGLDYRHLYGSLKESEVEVDLTWPVSYGKSGIKRELLQALGMLNPSFTELEFGQTLDLTINHFKKHGHRPWYWCFLPSKKNHVLISSRKILQLWGTEIIREVFGQDFWVNKTLEAIGSSNPDVAIITDMRFPVEVEIVKRAFPEARIVKVVRPGQKLIESSSHASEAGLPEDVISTTIRNDGTLEELREKALDLVK